MSKNKNKYQQRSEKQKIQNKVGQVELSQSDLISKMKEEILNEARALANGTSNHLGRLVQLTKELIEEESEAEDLEASFK